MGLSHRVVVVEVFFKFTLVTELKHEKGGTLLIILEISVRPYQIVVVNGGENPALILEELVKLGILLPHFCNLHNFYCHSS